MGNWETCWGGIQLNTAPDVFAPGTDAVVLADFMRLTGTARVCDLGCGGGILGLLLCGRNTGCHVTGLELQHRACELAAKNAAQNGLTNRFCVVPGDLRKIRTLLPANGFTHVISNPPYFDVRSPVAPPAERAAARSEQTCTLTDLCAAAAWLLSYGGTFTLVYRPERLCDLFCALRGEKLEPKRIRFVRHRLDTPISLVLVEAKYGGNPGLRFEPDLILTESDGTPSPEAQRIYHGKGEA